MNIFVVGTGRCGTTSFAEACRYMSSFTVGHETNAVGLRYPTNHIEVNSQLTWRTPALIQKYPEALWVHLIRERESCAESIAQMGGGSVVAGLQQLYPSLYPDDPLEAARIFYDMANDVIVATIPRRKILFLETIQEEWPSFWKWACAEGDYDGSLASWSVKKNARPS